MYRNTMRGSITIMFENDEEEEEARKRLAEIGIEYIGRVIDSSQLKGIGPWAIMNAYMGANTQGYNIIRGDWTHKEHIKETDLDGRPYFVKSEMRELYGEMD